MQQKETKERQELLRAADAFSPIADEIILSSEELTAKEMLELQEELLDF